MMRVRRNIGGKKKKPKNRSSDPSKKRAGSFAKKEFCVLITSYNRPKSLLDMLEKLNKFSKEIDIFIINDYSTKSYKEVLSFVAERGNIFYLENSKNLGKQNYYQTINKLLKKVAVKKGLYNNLIMLQDDFIIPNKFIKFVKDYLDKIPERNLAILNLHIDILRRYNSCWDSGTPKPVNEHIEETGWVDCNFATSIRVMNSLGWRVDGQSARGPGATSSGVGRSLTYRLRKLGVKMYRVKRSLLFHKDIASSLNLDRRYIIQNFNYIEKINRKIKIGIATTKSREKYLKKTIMSLKDQCDEIHVYLNDYYKPSNISNVYFYPGEDIYKDTGDLGKFLFQHNYGFYLTCDDDIIYPKDYVKRIIKGCEKHKCPVGFHGSILKPKDKYYNNSKRKKIHFTNQLEKDVYVNMLGTGTVGFNCTEINIPFYEFRRKNMADVWFAIFCQERRMPMVCLGRKKNYLISQKLDDKIKTIYKSSIERDGSSKDNKVFLEKLVSSRDWRLYEYK